MMASVTDLPPPGDVEEPVARLTVELAHHLGVPAYVALCVDLLAGAPREEHLAELVYLTGLTFEPGSARLDPARWPDHWVRTWGARGLLHVWDDAATDAVVAGLGDEHWRPAEMCLKVACRHQVGGSADGAVALATHELPRVRSQAMRTLGACGDTEHVDAVRDRLHDPHEDVRRQAHRALERLAARLDLVDEP